MITYDNFTHLNIGPRDFIVNGIIFTIRCLFVCYGHTSHSHCVRACVRACVRVRGACVRASERVWRVIALITLELELACL